MTSRVERRVAVGFTLVVALLVGFGIAGWHSSSQIAAAAAQAQQTQRVLTLLAALMAAAADAESSQRAFALSGDPAQLEPYAPARSRADALMADLRTLLAASPEQYSRLVALAPPLAQRFDALAAAVEQRQHGSAAANTPAALAEGKRLQDKVRRALAEMQQRAQDDLAADQERSGAAARQAQTVIAVGSAAAVLLATLGAWRLHRSLRKLRRVETQRAEAAAREQKLSFDLQRVLDQSLDAICIFDSAGRFVQASAACERLWGWRAQELKGKPYIDMVLPEDQPRTRAIAARVMAGHPATDLRNRCRRRDGSVAHLLWSAVWSHDDETLFAVVRDIGDVETLREQVARQNAALRSAASELALAAERSEAAGKLQSAFVATISDELRAPLDSIIGFSAILLQGLPGPVNAEQRKQLTIVAQSARHLLTVVNDMLDLSRLEAGLLDVVREPFDLWESIAKVAASVRPQAADKGLALNLEVDRELGLARGDAQRFEQVLLNLVGNAIKFTATGSVTIAAAAPADAPADAAADAPGKLRVTVTDTGIGIAAADLDGLFKPFRKLDAGPTRGHEGRGLGLVISRRLAELMGGSLSVTSEPGRGSRFELTLPADGATAT